MKELRFRCGDALIDIVYIVLHIARLPIGVKWRVELLLAAK